MSEISIAMRKAKADEVSLVALRMLFDPVVNSIIEVSKKQLRLATTKDAKGKAVDKVGGRRKSL